MEIISRMEILTLWLQQNNLNARLLEGYFDICGHISLIISY